jgi:hypothetical protein
MTNLLPQLVLAIAIASFVPGTAMADLGSAEQATTGLTKFNVWCSRRGNDCTVEISDSKIVVDGKGGVPKEKVLKIWRDKEMRNFWDRNPLNYYQDVFYVTYRKDDGGEATGKFIVLHERTGSEFWNRLETFLGSQSRPIGPIIKIE